MTAEGERLRQGGQRHILALDGGGVRGVLTLHLLKSFEERFSRPACEFFDMFAGTSTGAIIAALLAYKRFTAPEILDLYRELVGRVFQWSLSSSRIGRLFSRVMYSRDFALCKLADLFRDTTLEDLQVGPRGPQGILLTTHDLVRNEELFLSNFPLKGGSPNFGPSWKVRDAVAASALSAPWYFGPWDGRFTDGGMTVFNTPARQAAIEALDYCARPEFPEGRTVVWSFGSGAFETQFEPGDGDRWFPWNWAARLFRDVQSDAEADQIYGVLRMQREGEISFRRYQVTITPDSVRELGVTTPIPELPIQLDQADAVEFLDELGERFASRIDWSNPSGLVISRERPPIFADAGLWRSKEPPPEEAVARLEAHAKPSARLT